MGKTSSFNISTIITSSFEDLQDVLLEQDIPPVDWIEQPIIIIPHIVNERPSTPDSTAESSDTTIIDPRLGLVTPDATPTRSARTASAADTDYFTEVTPPPKYPDLIDQVVRSAQRASHRYHAPDRPSPSPMPQARHFDHQATFGTRTGNAFVHDRRIGAAGEAFVCLTS